MKDQNYAAMREHAHVDGVCPFPAVMQTRTIETNGTSIHVRVGGHGPAVVMLHGFGTTGDMWGHLASALIEDHMIVALDLRGLGLSSKPDGGYDKKNQAADVVGVLDALGVRTFELVTHDIGIMVGFAHALEHTGGYTPAEAKRVAGTLLPDVLPYDPTRPASFPDNGRTLSDDAFDFFIRILTNGRVTEDKVGPHRDLLLEFPYVGPPHQSRASKAPYRTTAMQYQK